MSLPVRVGTLILAFLVVVGGAIFVVIHFLLAGPPTVAYTADSSNTVHVVLQEDPQNTVSNHPDWVSYFVQNPSTKAWVHTTLFQVPAGAKVDVTILGYDGCTPIRNPFWGKVQGVRDYRVNGKPVPGNVLDTWRQCSVGHTFSIPGIGLSVPVASPTTFAANSNLCGVSPCTPVEAGKPVPVAKVTFNFTAPTTAGDYFWQCRIPCGLGYLAGFGGPMQTIGFMTGQMEVVS
jgi:hypothetical protein